LLSDLGSCDGSGLRGERTAIRGEVCACTDLANATTRISHPCLIAERVELMIRDVRGVVGGNGFRGVMLPRGGRAPLASLPLLRRPAAPIERGEMSTLTVATGRESVKGAKVKP
jgi:hypothetical protein